MSVLFKRNGSRTCLVPTFGRAITKLGRDTCLVQTFGRAGTKLGRDQVRDRRDRGAHGDLRRLRPPAVKQTILIQLMTSDRKLEASREGSK